MAGPYSPPIKNQAYQTVIALQSFATPGSQQLNPTLAAGDVKVRQAGSTTYNNITTLPVADGAGKSGVQLDLSATEMNADYVYVQFIDQTSPKEWADFCLTIETTLAVQPANVTQWLGSAVNSGGPAGIPRVDVLYWNGNQVNSDLFNNPLIGRNVIASGTAQSSGNDTTHIHFPIASSTDDDFYNGARVYVWAGTGILQTTMVTDYDGSTLIATVSPALSIPLTAVSHILVEAVQSDVEAWRLAQPNALQSGRVDAYIGAVASGVIAAASFASGALDAVWSTATRTLTAFAFSVTVGTNNDKTGYTLSSAGVQAIWDALTSALTTANSIGKLLVDNINATISSRLASASITLTGGAVTVGTNNDKTGYELSTTGLADFFTVDTGETYADAVDGSVVKEIATNAGGGGDPWSTALPGAYAAGTAGYIVGTNLDAKSSDIKAQTDQLHFHGNYVEADMKEISDATVDSSLAQVGANVVEWVGDNSVRDLENGLVPVIVWDYEAGDVAVNKVADALLKRDWTAVSGEASRSVLNALRFLRNRFSTIVAPGNVTIYKEDDTTVAYTKDVETDAAAEPIVEG